MEKATLLHNDMINDETDMDHCNKNMFHVLCERMACMFNVSSLLWQFMKVQFKIEQ